jgi:hypothetical protein
MILRCRRNFSGNGRRILGTDNWEIDMLHITDGESVAGTLRESAIPGQFSTYGDLMYEGPAQAGLDAEAWRDTCARFLG